MKVLKKQGLTLLLIVALVVALTLGIIFMMPARTASAEEEFTPDVTVGTEQALKEAVLSAKSGVNKKVQLTEDIALGIENVNGEAWGLRVAGGRDITLDLNGHKLTRASNDWILLCNVNSKLTLIDTKGNGVITNNMLYGGQPLIWNYGELITSVNLAVPDYVTHDGVTPYKDPYGLTSGNNAAISSVTDAGFAKAENSSWRKPSVTIKGGTLSGPAQGSIIKLTDSNLTITGGTFAPNHLLEAPEGYVLSSSSTRSIISASTLILRNEASGNIEEAKQALQEVSQIYAKYRGSDIKVTGGDFTAFKSNYGDFDIDREIQIGYLNSYTNGRTGEMVDITVSLDGESKWGKDLSAYTPEGQWMELYDPSIDEGQSAKKYYVVSDASEETAGAAVTVGQSTRYYRDFASAWGAIGTTTADRTLKLCNDVTVEQLDFSKMSGNITLDLNGKKLTIERSNSMSSGHIDFGSQRDLLKETDISLTVKDSQESGGEIILDTPSGGSINTNSFIHIQNYAKFTLESGTIRQTGYFPADRKEATKLDEIAAQAIFHLSPGVEANDVVTIKGGNIISDIYYGTEQDHGELTSSPYLVSWYVGTSEYELNFETGEKYSNKTEIFKFDLAESINAGKTSAFSWNFKAEGAAQWEALGETFNAFTFSGYGKDYLVSNFTEKDNFLGSDGKAYGTLNEAVEGKTGSNYSITVLQDKLPIDENVTLDGITLDLDRNRNFTLVLGEGVTLTLTNGATLRNGTLQGGVIVTGNATMRDTTVTGDVAVNGGTLTIPSGEYQGGFTVADGANAVISGGWFKGKAIDTVDQWFAFTLGAYIEAGQEYDDDTLYEVKIAPNLKAQEWYNANKSKEAFEIASTDEWNYFAIYVSSGVDVFQNETVRLTAKELDFGYRPEGVALFATRDAVQTFLPAGNQKYRFVGTFDGGNNTIKGIKVTEINAGLFGRTDGSAKINNLTVANSVFTGGRGVGYFDEYNTEKGWVFVGGVVAQGNLGHTAEGVAATGIKVQNVTLSQKEPGTIMGGGFIGQTWSTLYLKGIEVDNVTLDGGWKMGGVVGFTEASVFIIDGSVKNVKSARDCTYFGSVMGQLVGQALSLESCNVEASESYLVGGMDAGSEKKDVSIKGTGTAIVTKGVTDITGTTHGSHEVDLKVTVPTTEAETEQKGGFSLDFKEEEIPNDAYKTKDDKPVAAFRWENGNMGGYATLEEALKGATNGDTVVLNSDVEESVTISTDMVITLDLGGHTLTGTITVEGTITLGNGTVKGTIKNNGKLVFELSEGQTLTIEGPDEDGKAIEGNYEVGENVCKRSGADEHTLSFVYGHGETIYSVDGNVITLTCDVCHQVLGTVTLNAPENTTYTGAKIEATVVVNPEELVDAPAITYTNAEGEEVQEIILAGTYTASIELGGVTVSVSFEVTQRQLVISDIQGTITYSGEGEPTIEVSSYTLKDLAGNVVKPDGITVTVTLQKSKYNVGKQVALITAINMTGNSNYTLAVAGNEAFIELDVAAANLIVRVNRDGSVSYEGFVNGENESVLGGELHLEWVDNGDGTSTVTPSGLTSTNYVITFESGIVENEQSNNALWITLAVVGGVIAALGAVAVVYAVRRKKN